MVAGPVIEVRGGEVRCSGPPDAMHEDEMVKVPAGKVAECPKCGRRFRRTSWWNAISEAIWPG